MNKRDHDASLQADVLALVPDIAGFDSHLDFLGALLAAEKAARTDFSLDRVAKAMGLARSGLSMILSGARRITTTQIHSIARALKFDAEKHEMWECLVHAGQMDDPLDADVYLARLGRLRQSRHTVSVRTPSAHLVSAWYVPAILVYLIDLAGDEVAIDNLAPIIARDLGLASSQVSEVIDRLTNEGYLQYRGKGNVHVSFDRIAASISTKRFLKEVLNEATRRVEVDFDDRLSFFTSHAFSVSEADVSDIVREYKALLDRYVSQKSVSRHDGPGLDAAGGVGVVVTAFQMFPAISKKSSANTL